MWAMCPRPVRLLIFLLHPPLLGFDCISSNFQGRKTSVPLPARSKTEQITLHQCVVFLICVSHILLHQSYSMQAVNKCILDCVRRYIPAAIFFRFFFLLSIWKKRRKKQEKNEQKSGAFSLLWKDKICLLHVFVIHIFHHSNALPHRKCVEFEPERRQRRVRCDAVWRHLGAEFAHFVRNEKPNRKFTSNFYFCVRRHCVAEWVSRRVAHKIRVLLNSVEV